MRIALPYRVAATRAIALAIWSVLWLPLRAGQEMEPPVAGRPDDFSGIVGVYRIDITAAPTELHVEDPLTLVVKITGEGPAEFQPQRKSLRIFPPAMNEDFFIEPLPEKDRRLESEKAWEFAFRIRPKRDGVTMVPGLKLVYYHPARRKFQSSYATAIELKVTPKPAVQPPIVAEAVSAPAHFFELTSAAEVLGQNSRWRLDQPIVLLALLLAPPILALAWRWRDHRDRRNGMHLALLLRSQAAKHALHTLEQSQNQGGEKVFVVLNEYLHQRFDVPMAEPSQREVERVLGRAGVGKAVRNRVKQFLDACDAVRFGPNGKADSLLAGQAAQLIQVLEEESCRRS